MAVGYENSRRDFLSNDYSYLLHNLVGELSEKWKRRLERIREEWDFYEGYHWQDIPQNDAPNITFNYCRAFVNKFVAFELGKGFTFTVDSDLSETKLTEDGRTMFEYLEDVWEDNDLLSYCVEMGQTKSVTGEAWTQISYVPPEELDDPFGEYPNGRIDIRVVPTNVVFPEFDPHDSKKLVRLTMMYVYKKVKTTGILGKRTEEDTVYRQVWTKDSVTTQDGKSEPVTIENPYGIIPFVQIKNLAIAGKDEGLGDLDDIIPLNTEYNMKLSNVSEIIDYHAAPITVVYGARVGNLEKGANKIWGGLPKDAKVSNLEMKSDSDLASGYMDNIKLAMCEVGGIPETVLGGAQAISNTSGVALQYINLPLIERTRMKKQFTEKGLELVNKYILLISVKMGLLKESEEVDKKKFYHVEVDLPDTLPKDTLIELQQISMEMSIGIEDRFGAARRMGKENIEELLKRVDEDRKEHPEYYGGDDNPKTNGLTTEVGNSKLNSGMTNGQSAKEHIRVALNGKNGND